MTVFQEIVVESILPNQIIWSWYHSFQKTMFYLTKSKYAIFANFKVTKIERSAFGGTPGIIRTGAVQKQTVNSPLIYSLLHAGVNEKVKLRFCRSGITSRDDFCVMCYLNFYVECYLKFSLFVQAIAKHIPCLIYLYCATPLLPYDAYEFCFKWSVCVCVRCTSEILWTG